MTDNQEISIFQEVQKQHNILTVAQQNLGLRVKKIGNTWRAQSLAKDGGGENALALYESTNSFYDFKLQQGGDIAQLVATAKYDGDIRAALQELLPDFYSKNSWRVDKELKAKKEFMDKIDYWHREILKSDNEISKCALKYLMDRGIKLDTIKTLKIGLKVENSEGFRIVFPYWDEQGRNVIYFTSRKFPYHRDNNGNIYEDEKAPKYKKAPLQYYPFLRNAPMGLNSLKCKGYNEDGTLVITEGVMDCLVFIQEGYSVLSPNGGGDDKFWKEALEKIDEFKRVVLAFDSDDAGKEFTYKAAKILMEHGIPFECVDNIMTKDVAEFYQIAGNLDSLMVSTRHGLTWIIDSLKRPEPFEELTIKQQREILAKCKEVLYQIAIDASPSQLHEVMMGMRNYLPRAWVSDTIKEIKDAAKGNKKEKLKDRQIRAAQCVVDHHNLCYDPRTGFYEYSIDDHKWIKRNDETIGGYVMGAYGDEVTGNILTSVLKLIKSDFRINNDDPVTKFNTLPLLTFLNGTLHIDLNTGAVKIKPSCSTDYNTVCLPYFYNEREKCPQWLKFIDEVTGGDKDAQKTLQEFPAYALMPDCEFQKCLLLKGCGANGKSLYSEVISAVFGGTGADGRGYVSHVEPGRFRDQFSLMPFMNSFINISSDTETDLKNSEGVFKRIVAGETLEDSYKFRDKIQFRTRTKLIMCCNNFPVTGDTSIGFMRRFLIVNFPMHYVDNPKPHVKNERKINYSLKDELLKELPGIFNWIIQGLQRLIRQKGFTKSLKEEKLLHEFRVVNNHVFAFVDENMHVFFNEDGSGKKINRRDIFKAYLAWCEGEYVQPISAHRFYSNLRGVLNSYGITFTEDGLMWTFDNDPELEQELEEMYYEDHPDDDSQYLQDPEAFDEQYKEYEQDEQEDDDYDEAIGK